MNQNHNRSEQRIIFGIENNPDQVLAVIILQNHLDLLPIICDRRPGFLAQVIPGDASEFSFGGHGKGILLVLTAEQTGEQNHKQAQINLIHSFHNHW